MFHTNDAERDEMPERFLSLLNKVERCIDFESKEPPTWIQVYGRNNTMYIVNDLNRLVDLSGNRAATEVNRLLAIITCNQNVVAIASVFTGIKVELEPGRGTEIETEDDLRREIEEHGADGVYQVITAGYETRTCIYQAHSKLYLTGDEEFGEPSLGEWVYGKATSKQMRDAGQEACSGLRGFFVAGERVHKVFKEAE